eukprot:SAG11_NODE_13098_length_670_cov_0.994746_1_plen_52_part_10
MTGYKIVRVSYSLPLLCKYFALPLSAAEYITYQIGLPPQYMNTGGLYRDDRT